MEKKPAPMAFAYLLPVIRTMIFGSTVLFTSRLLQTASVLALRFLFAAVAFLIPAGAVGGNLPAIR